MVEKYHKILLSFGMETGCLPHANQSVGRKAPKWAHDDLESLFDDEDSDGGRFESLVPKKYLQSTHNPSKLVKHYATVPMLYGYWHPYLCAIRFATVPGTAISYGL